MRKAVDFEQLWLPLYTAECVVIPKPEVTLDSLLASLRERAIPAYRHNGHIVAQFSYQSPRSFAQASDVVFRSPGVQQLAYTMPTQETYQWLARIEERQRLAEIKAFRGDQG